MTAARFAFPFWYSACDLLHPRVRPATVAAVMSIALATATATLALALPEIDTAIRLQRLENSPTARGICLNDRSTGFGPDRLESIRAKLNEFDPPLAPFELAGFHSISNMEFRCVPGGNDPNGESFQAFTGRTFPADDPAGAEWNRIVQSPVTVAPNGPGILVSPRLLAALGYEIGTCPESLVVRFRGSPVQMRIAPVAVSREPLPWNYRFWMGESQDAALRATRNQPLENILSGPVPVSWRLEMKDCGGLCTEIWKEKYGNEYAPVFSVIMDKGEQRLHCRLANGLETLKIEVWCDMLTKLSREMEAAFGKQDSANFLVPVFDEPKKSAPSRGDFHALGIYVGALRDLRTITPLAEEQADFIHDGARSAVDEIESSAARTRRILSGVVTGFFVAGGAALALALVLRAQQKTAQFGMLRAMGIGPGTLAALLLADAAWLWLAGTLAAVGFASATGLVLSQRFGVSFEEVRSAATAGNWGTAMFFSAGYLAVALAANWFATRPARRQAPIRALAQAA